ncbi:MULTISPECIES: hypothetical protein [Streptomyces]|uniref:Uncharacterized protein n=1 Tax=Streptomyces odorifer TaxID=53450 RepID=A0A7Y6C6E5_9ACTN|nr:hypothetical protein [Streptomyces odorifer]NUV27876.1 hypothetical protein [Streptomyces odorifer]NUV33993.1 hypothetical protein [Streptomyces sp. KAI-27]NUV50222.1 hypothetical protein [Streptomyces sp. CAI-78]
MGIKTKIALGTVVGVVVIGGLASLGDDHAADTAKGGDTSNSAPASGGDKADKAEPAEEKPKASQAEQFKAFVEENGTPKEKEAASHVTKVQGAEKQNNVLDTADIYTDYTGGVMGEGLGPAKLLTSAFADWKQSKNGLVTVYDADGELLGNGEF